MPEVIFNGPAGRLEGRFHQAEDPNAPIALIMHPHPQFGGTMNNPIVHALYYMFVRRGFSVLRFNFRGVGRSQGLFDNGAGELADAAAALDWLQLVTKEPRSCWLAGVSFGSWISMQLLMRRPEVQGFITIAPLAKHYDFSFLAPCPTSGLFVNGAEDKVTPPEEVEKLVKKLKTQKGITIDHVVIPGANHFFEGKRDELIAVCDDYLVRRMEEMGLPVA
ncbi:alpha/beta hydrolase [Thermopetrobacter sp. TC1]|uniref:alpha/beta hydrolase n=1 Tax=Thermopetrobacter sp. TC1 TaxID=1495045 RepID=UPI00056EF209|nr:alpha/beta hydrolase [Thermopetrobacter sp. TC1]